MKTIKLTATIQVAVSVSEQRTLDAIQQAQRVFADQLNNSEIHLLSSIDYTNIDLNPEDFPD